MLFNKQLISKCKSNQSFQVSDGTMVMTVRYFEILKMFIELENLINLSDGILTAFKNKTSSNHVFVSTVVKIKSTSF